MGMEFANGDKIYHVELNTIIDAQNENGVLEGLEITAQSTPSMTLDVGTGQCVVNIELYEEASATTVTVGTSHATLPRIDLVRYDTSLRMILVTAGTAAATPVPPNIPTGDILLAIVNVPAAATVIVAGNIIDERIIITPLKLTYSASDTLLDSDDTEEYHTQDSYQKEKEIEITAETFVGGSEFRIKFDLRTNNVTSAAYGRIYRNGSPVGTERSTTNTSYVNYSEDISGWSAGDLIQLYTKAGTFGFAVYVRNYRVYGDVVVDSVYGWT